MSDFWALRPVVTPVIIQVLFWIGASLCIRRLNQPRRRQPEMHAVKLGSRTGQINSRQGDHHE